MKTIIVFSPIAGMSKDLILAVNYMKKKGYQIEQYYVLSDNKDFFVNILAKMDPGPEFVFINYFQKEGDEEIIAEIDYNACHGRGAYSKNDLELLSLTEEVKASFALKPLIVAFLPKVSNSFPSYFTYVRSDDSCLKTEEAFYQFCDKEIAMHRRTQLFLKSKS